MKSRRQKVFAILVACLLCASFFVIPVSAANVSSTSFELPIPTYVEDDMFFRVGFASRNFDPIDDLPWNDLNRPNNIMYIGSSSDPSGVTYEFSDPDADFKSGAISFWIGQSSFNLTRYGPSNIFWLDPGEFTLEVLPGSNLRLLQYRFSLRLIESNGVIGNVIATTPVNRLNIDGNSVDWDVISYPGLEFTFNSTSNGLGLLLCLDVLYDSSRSTSSTNSVSLYKDVFTVYGSDGPDPNLPQYSPPDHGDLGELEDMEDELMDSADAGLTLLEDLFTNFTSRVEPFFAVFDRISIILNRFVGGIPLLETVVYLALTFGCFSSMLGLAGAIISSADRKGRDARKSSKDNQNKSNSD